MTTDDRPTRRRSDRWMQWTAVAFMLVTGLAGTLVLGSEIAFKLVHGFGLHGGLGAHGCRELWGLGPSIAGSAALFLSSAAYSAGSPARTGRAMLRALASRIGGDGE